MDTTCFFFRDRVSILDDSQTDQAYYPVIDWAIACSRMWGGNSSGLDPGAESTVLSSLPSILPHRSVSIDEVFQRNKFVLRRLARRVHHARRRSMADLPTPILNPDAPNGCNTMSPLQRSEFGGAMLALGWRWADSVGYNQGTLDIQGGPVYPR